MYPFEASLQLLHQGVEPLACPSFAGDAPPGKRHNRETFVRGVDQAFVESGTPRDHVVHTNAGTQPNQTPEGRLSR